jgi:hypothetical protein
MVSCSDDDSFTTDAGALLSFSVDSVKMDTVFSGVATSTYSFWVYNRNKEGLRLPTVRLRQGNQTGFRVNVDGSYLDNQRGSVVNDLEVRGGDSIRVFVELTAAENGLDEPQLTEDDLLFHLESGVVQRVCLSAWAWDAVCMDSLVVSRDSLISSRKPIMVYGDIRVDSTATLTIRSTRLFFHDKAGIDVYGTLLLDSVLLRGDRLDNMFDYLPYDRVSGQWRGVHFFPSSTRNVLKNSEIRNATHALLVDSAALDTLEVRLAMDHCIVHNSKGAGLKAFNAFITLSYCQFTNMLEDCISVFGGLVGMDHCTLGQYYPFSADRGVALRFQNFYNDYNYPLLLLQCTNSLVTGYADDEVMGNRRDSLAAYAYYFENSLLRTPAVSDTTNFRGIVWEDPKDEAMGKARFVLIDEKNLKYDFHLVDSLETCREWGCYPL